jgi:hypothetical protein
MCIRDYITYTYGVSLIQMKSGLLIAIRHMGRVITATTTRGNGGAEGREISQDGKKQGFYTRGFTTFVIAFSFLIIAATGTVMFFTPRGRVANWTNWTVLGLDKDQWSSVHITAATLFIIMAALHIFFNWKVLLGYLRLKRVKGLRLKKELAAALALSLVFVVGTLGGLPPFGVLIDVHGQVKDYWDEVSAQAPLPHAEELTLAQFSLQIETPLEEVMRALSEKGIEIENGRVTLASLAEAYHLAPSDLHAVIRPDGSTADRHITGHTASGLGRMTISKYCTANRLDVDDFLHALGKRGVEANRESSLRELASSLGMTPGELVNMLGEHTPETL